MPNAVVFGATGYAGTHIVRELVARGFSVTAIARNVGPGRSPMRQVSWRSGSIHDTVLVDQVALAADVIVSAVPSRSNGQENLSASIPQLLRSARKTGARLAVVGGAGTLMAPTGLGTVAEQPTFPEAFKANAMAHAEVIESVRVDTSGTELFYLSPPAQFGAAFDGPRLGNYRVGLDTLVAAPDGVSTISGPDYTLAFVDEVEAPEHRNMRFTVAY